MDCVHCPASRLKLMAGAWQQAWAHYYRVTSNTCTKINSVMFPQSWTLCFQSLILLAKDEVTPPRPQRPVAQRNNEKHLSQSIPLVSCNLFFARGRFLPHSLHSECLLCNRLGTVCWPSNSKKYLMKNWPNHLRNAVLHFLYSWHSLMIIVIETTGAEAATVIHLVLIKCQHWINHFFFSVLFNVHFHNNWGWDYHFFFPY